MSPESIPQPTFEEPKEYEYRETNPRPGSGHATPMGQELLGNIDAGLRQGVKNVGTSLKNMGKGALGLMGIPWDAPPKDAGPMEFMKAQRQRSLAERDQAYQGSRSDVLDAFNKLNLASKETQWKLYRNDKTIEAGARTPEEREKLEPKLREQFEKEWPEIKKRVEAQYGVSTPGDR